MTRTQQVRFMLLSWLALLTAVFVVSPEHGMQFMWLSAGLGVVALGFLFPDVSLIMAMVSLMLTAENFLFFYNFNLNNDDIFGSSTFHKAVSLALLVPSLMRYGVRPVMNFGILALVGILVASFMFATKLPVLTQAQMFQTFVGLSIPLMVFNMRFNPRSIDSHMRIMAWLPILSVVLGLFAEWAGLLGNDGVPWGVFSFEYMTNSYRLSGINIPSGIAAIAYIAFFISIYQAILYKKNGYYGLAVVAFIITLLAGSRTPLAAEILFAGVGIFISSSKELGSRVKLNVGVAGAAVIVVAMGLYWPTLAQRFQSPDGNGDVINTSGRSDIWDIEYTAWQKNPMFGRGIGAGAVILLDEARLNLVEARATHNEYLRLLLDGGIFGLLAYIAGFAALILRDLQGTSSTTKRLTASLFLSFAIWSFFDNTISSGTTLETFYAVALLLFQARLHQRRERYQALQS